LHIFARLAMLIAMSLILLMGVVPGPETPLEIG
jgi:hypothetical protein